MYKNIKGRKNEEQNQYHKKTKLKVYRQNKTREKTTEEEKH